MQRVPCKNSTPSTQDHGYTSPSHQPTMLCVEEGVPCEVFTPVAQKVDVACPSNGSFRRSSLGVSNCGSLKLKVMENGYEDSTPFAQKIDVACPSNGSFRRSSLGVSNCGSPKLKVMEHGGTALEFSSPRRLCSEVVSTSNDGSIQFKRRTEIWATCTSSCQRTVEVCVENIHAILDSDSVLSLLQICGPVKHWKFIQIEKAHRSKAYCRFISGEGALRALRLINKIKVLGQRLEVTLISETETQLKSYIQTENMEKGDRVALLQITTKKYKMEKIADQILRKEMIKERTEEKKKRAAKLEYKWRVLERENRRKEERQS